MSWAAGAPKETTEGMQPSLKSITNVRKSARKERNRFPFQILVLVSKAASWYILCLLLLLLLLCGLFFSSLPCRLTFWQGSSNKFAK